MKLKKILLTGYSLFMLLFAVHAGERTEPAVFYIAVDTSLSLKEKSGETAPFADMQQWLTGEFIPLYLISGDRVVLFSFCGTTQKIADITLHTDEDVARLNRTVSEMAPDGSFTDIGLAVDTVKQAVTADSSGVPHAVVLCSDLIQEAPHTSPYAGTYVFAERFLPPFKSIPHRLGGAAAGKVSWYQLFLLVDGETRIAEVSEKLYSAVTAAGTVRAAAD